MAFFISSNYTGTNFIPWELHSRFTPILFTPHTLSWFIPPNLNLVQTHKYYSVHCRDPCLRTQTFTVSGYFTCYFWCYQIANISLTFLLYLCFILSIIRRLDYTAAIQELLSFLGIGTKQLWHQLCFLGDHWDIRLSYCIISVLWQGFHRFTWSSFIKK